MSAFRNMKVEKMEGRKKKFMRFQSDIGSPDIFLDPKAFLNTKHEPFKNESVRQLGKWSGFQGFGKPFSFGVSRVFSEDHKASKTQIFDPRSKFIQNWNKFFVISCLIAVFVDPLFFYLPIIQTKDICVFFDNSMKISVTVLRTIADISYLFHMVLQFRTAFIAPSSRIFGRGELVVNPFQIARRYLRKDFWVDFAAVLPLPQQHITMPLRDCHSPFDYITFCLLYGALLGGAFLCCIILLQIVMHLCVHLNLSAEIVNFQFFVWVVLPAMKGTVADNTKNALRLVVLIQYVPRFLRIFPLTSQMVKTTGVVTETAWGGAAYNLALYMLASHVLGACWYLLAVDRENTCWKEHCTDDCKYDFFNCYNRNDSEWTLWSSSAAKSSLQKACSLDSEDNDFNFGIYSDALQNSITSTTHVIAKYFYCFWWGLKNLSTLGQGLETSSYIGEALFSITVGILGLILFALLLGNMQRYLQSLTVRLEEMRLKRRDTEQWMRHRQLPPSLRERVRRYDQYKWVATRGVDEETLLRGLPHDLRREIKRHLCLKLVKGVPMFEKMDDRLLDAICEHLKPALHTEGTFIVREGDPVNEMLFIIRGSLESVTTNGGRSGFFNVGPGDFCGEELLTWALHPKPSKVFPNSTRTVKALVEVEAFALKGEDLKVVAGQFRRVHSKQLQHTFRYYSQQWRTWAALYIQAAWRRYQRRRFAEIRRKEAEAIAFAAADRAASPSLGATLLASRFAANAMRGVQRLRILNASQVPKVIRKPAEPDFSLDDDE